MSSSFVINFMQMAHQVTGAERSIAFDEALTLQSQAVGVPVPAVDTDIESIVREALEKGEIILSNNMIRNPEDAPSTNVHLGSLRMVLAVPLQGHGAVYLDKPVKQGVFDKETVSRLTELANRLVAEDDTTLSADAMIAYYDNLN